MPIAAVHGRDPATPWIARDEAKKRGLILISERAVALLQKSGG
jgi:hypothetical protein